VTASDGVRQSATVDASAALLDRAPSLTRLVLSPKDSVSVGESLTVAASANDPDGDPVSYEYSWFVNGEQIEASGETLATDALKRGDSVYAEVRAGDGINWSAPERTAAVALGSGHPEITSQPPGLREDGEFRYQVVAVDPDGDRVLRYSLESGPPGMAIDSVLGELVWRPRKDQKAGVYPVRLIVRDSTGLETKQSFTVTLQEFERDAVAVQEKKKSAPADLAPETETDEEPAEQ
jgi:hypothetical protein